jgi:hypothetical protein
MLTGIASSDENCRYYKRTAKQKSMHELEERQGKQEIESALQKMRKHIEPGR